MSDPFRETLECFMREIEVRDCGGQCRVNRAGETVFDLAAGCARPGLPMTAESMVPWLSAGKPITAIAIAQLVEKGLMELSNHVAKFLPEFGVGGKETITIEHLLTHTGGFRTADKLVDGRSWKESIRNICQTPLEPGWVPGEKAGYHTSSSWLILGEIIQRVSGTSFDDYIGARIFGPLGMGHCTFKLSEGILAREQWVLVELTENSQMHAWLNRPERLRQSNPGSSARGPLAELVKFYRALLEPEGLAQLGISCETAERFCRRRRVAMFDHTFLHVLDWGLGFVVNSNRHGLKTVPYGYGPFCSEETFGHSGAQLACAFADPANDLVVAWMFNGMPGERIHQRRARELNAAIYADLGLGELKKLGA